MSTSLISWLAYALFAVIALYSNWHPELLSFAGPLGAFKLVVWIAFVVFLAYSVYCSSRESIFRSVPKIFEFHWGRQITADLYLGLALALFVVYLNEGALAVALWALPTLLFANLAILLYFAIHFESIVSRFLA